MKCCDRELLFGFCQGFLAAGEEARVRAHVAECAACRAIVEEYGRLDTLLDDWRPVEPSPWFDARVRAAVRTASPPSRPSLFGSQWARRLVPALGVVLVLVAVLVIWWSRRTPQPSIPQIAISPAKPQTPPPAVARAPEPPTTSPTVTATPQSPAVPQVATRTPTPETGLPPTAPAVALPAPPTPPQVAVQAPPPTLAPPETQAVATLPVLPIPRQVAKEVPAAAPQVAHTQPAQAEPLTLASAEKELSLYENLPVLEDYDLLASFDVLSELPRKGNQVDY